MSEQDKTKGTDDAQNREDMLMDMYKLPAYIPNDAEGNPLTPFGNFSAGYEAASQHYDREIAELNKQYLTLHYSTTLIANKYLELSAQVNQLREKLENALTSLEESQEKECRCYYTR